MYPNVSPPEPAPPDHHLLTPSSILRQLKENAVVSHSQSSLEEINCNKKSNFLCEIFITNLYFLSIFNKKKTS